MEGERMRRMHVWMYECECVDPPFPQPMAPFYSGKSNPFGYPRFNENQFQLILGCYMHEHG